MANVVNSDCAPAAIGPYVQAMDLGTMIFVSGQLPIDASTGNMSDNVKQQAQQSLTNIKAILNQANYGIHHIVKATIFLSDLNDFADVNSIYEDFFKQHTASFPARSCVQVARIPKDAKVEIEVIAAK